MFGGKKLRLLHIKTAKSKAENQLKILSFTKKELPIKENRATDNYRINFYGKIVKKK